MISEYRLAERLGLWYVRFLILMTTVAFLAGCKGSHASSENARENEGVLEYSELLSIAEHPGFTEVTVRNPWDSVTNLHKYILVDRGAKLPGNLPEGTVVRVPLANSLIYSTVHCGLVEELGAVEAIGGVCNADYVKSRKLRERIDAGTVVDCGSGQTPNLERIIKLRPDAILLSPYENNDRYSKVGDLGIPIIECADYMETSALGRAEWMKFYGLLFGKSSEAENMFGKTVGEYNRIKDLANATAERPSVLVDQRYGQVWNVPGGESTIGRLIEDAGGRNPFSGFKKSGSVALAPEKVLAMAHDADVWFVRYNQPQEKPLSELSSDAPVNSRFAAFKSGNVYGCNTRFVDFYEETPFHPDRLLRDFALVLHPELENPGDTLRYYHKMK